MKSSLLLSLLFTTCLISSADAQKVEPYNPIYEQTKVMGFVILKSSKNYEETKLFAEQAAQKLKLPLDLRGLTPHPKTGLSRSAADCEDLGGFPCYEARGAWDKTFPYISIEYSNMYASFTKGYYIVVAATFDSKNTKLTETLNKARSRYPDAYLKTDNVYMGCTH